MCFQTVYTIDHGSVPAETVSNPAPPVPAASVLQRSTPETAQDGPAMEAGTPVEVAPPSAAEGAQVTTQAEVNAHLNPSFQKD